MATSQGTCPRHPDVETRLRCSACEGLICPSCWVDAPVGYHCPDCAAARTAAAAAAGARIRGQRSSGARDSAARSAHDLPVSLAVRSTALGLAASAAGGLVLGPIFVGGAFFLISAGVIGWLVARAVLWAAAERATPYVRAVALTLAGFSVAIGLATASVGPAPAGLAVLAYPAAVWGGWIVVRQR